jgi:hypothetical protein
MSKHIFALQESQSISMKVTKIHREYAQELQVRVYKTHSKLSQIDLLSHCTIELV